MQPEMANQPITRRDFAAHSLGALTSGLVWAGFPAAVAAQAALSPPTTVLINEAALRKRYPQDIAALLEALQKFVNSKNGDILDVGRETTARGIKAQLLRHSRHPKRLVIFGEEDGIPRYKVKGRNLDLDTDYFYGDLDGDGFAEVALSRVLGSPQAMIRQLGHSSPQVDAPKALLFGGEPRQHLEMNRFVSFLGDAGCAIEIRGAGDTQALAQADLVGLEGHGDPNGWYGGAGGPYVTANTVPDLPRHPVVFAGACSTATPGAPILRAFLERGCRAYIGAASEAYGWTPGAYGNELFMHLLDVARAHHDWTVAAIIGESRNRYARVNHLGPTLLRLERGEMVDFDLVDVSTALQFQVFGDITAKFPAAKPRHPFALYPITSSAVTLKPASAVSVSFQVGPSDGIPTLFLRADWASHLCAHLEIEISQNRQLLHTIDWKKQREWYEFVDMNVGGYAEGDHYHAYAIVPLFRREGTNEAVVALKHAAQPIQLLSDSAVQVWTRRNPPHPPPKQLTRKAGINLLLLADKEGLDPLRHALASIEQVQVDVQDNLGDPLDPYEFPSKRDQFLDLSVYDVILVDELPRGFHRFPRGSMTRCRDFVKQGGGLIMLGSHKTFGGNKDDGGFGGTPIEELLPVWIGKNIQVFAAESVYLGRLGGYDDRGANQTQFEGHLGWAQHQPANVVVDNLVMKYTFQFDRQARASTAAAQRFYGEASARLASYGVDLGDAGSNLKEVGPHVDWARRQSAEALRQAIENKVRTLLAGVPNGLIVEQKTLLGPIKSHPISAGLDWSHFPEIGGYNRVTAKPGANVLASTKSGDPLLTVWQFGQGRSAAFTTSFGRKWAPEFHNWPSYARFWGNLIRWVVRVGEKPD